MEYVNAFACCYGTLRHTKYKDRQTFLISLFDFFSLVITNLKLPKTGQLVQVTWISLSKLLVMGLSFVLLVNYASNQLQSALAQIPGIMPAEQSPEKPESSSTEQQQQQGPDNSSRSSASMLVYDNPTYGVKIEYPVGWNKTELSNSGSIRSASITTNSSNNNNNNYTKLASFHSPYENDSDRYSEALYITIDNLPSRNIQLEEYAKAKINSLQQTFANFRLVGSYPTTFTGNIRGNELVFTASVPFPQNQLTQDNASLKIMEVYAIDGDKAYNLAYFAEPSRYDTYLPQITQMVKSFEMPISEENTSNASSSTAVTPTSVPTASPVVGQTSGNSGSSSHTSQHSHNSSTSSGSDNNHRGSSTSSGSNHPTKHTPKKGSSPSDSQSHGSTDSPNSGSK